MGLTNITIKNASNGRLSDGRGLILIKTGDKGRWVFRYQRLGRRRDMGLGPWPTITLAEARKIRDQWASVIALGRDPITQRNTTQAAEKAELSKDNPTLIEMTDMVFEARKATLRGDGTRGRWKSPLTRHILPKIGTTRILDLHQTEIRDTLKPIWKTKYPTAEKAIQRLRIVVRDAQLMGYGCDPFVVDAAKQMLGTVNHKVTHTAFTPWRDVPQLYRQLNPDTASGLCLRWMILTVVRSDGCRGARTNEIDGDVWTVPPQRVKGTAKGVTAFRVPLSAPALAIAADANHADLLFPGQSLNKPISDRAIEKYLDNLGEQGRPHGLRSSFRTWAEETNQPWDAAEMSLGHTIKSKVERSYARSDLLDRRRELLDGWAAFVTGQ